MHPKYKTKYRVRNWAEYEKGLVDRGDLTLWLSPEAMKTWNCTPSGRPGGQRKYSDLAIETALMVRLLLHLPLRQVEGFLRSIFRILNLDLLAPDHTTLSRRAKRLQVAIAKPPTQGPIHLAIDSTGLSVVGEGEWAARKHGKRGIQGWKKLHLAVDQDGMILAHEVTGHEGDDGSVGIDLLKILKEEVEKVTADRAYDTRPFYNAANESGAHVVVPPIKNAQICRDDPPNRVATIKRIKKVGRRKWKKESGYHKQARAENAIWRFKKIIGPRLRSRDPATQRTEVAIGCDILNRMRMMTKPDSYAVVS